MKIDYAGYPHQFEKVVEEKCPRCGTKLVETTVSRYVTLKEGFYRVLLRCDNDTCGKFIVEMPS